MVRDKTTKNIFLRGPQIKEAISLAKRANFLLTGIEILEEVSLLIQCGFITPEELENLRSWGDLWKIL